MDEAKVPCDDADWNYVDIYLFANGQQQTPPRKYHLTTNDLNNWNATLATLANSLYDNIFSSIDLYTLDGVKVHTPMQLSPDAVYVAVPPQDTFIHAGYNEYLIKASRSREKRKSKTLGINEQVRSKSEEEKSKEKEENDTKILDEEREITERIIFPNTQKLSQNTTKNGTQGTKQSERKLSLTKPPGEKKNNSYIGQSMTRRTSMKTKDNGPKKNLKVNTSNIANGSTLSRIGNNSLISSKPKILSKLNKLSKEEREASVPITLSRINESMPSHFSISAQDKNIVTESSTVGNTIDDKEVIVFKTPDDSEITTMIFERDKSASVFGRHSKPSILTTKDKNNKSKINKIDPLITVVQNTENFLKSDAAIVNNVISNNKIDINACDVALAKETEVNNETMVSNPPTADSFVNRVNRRDIVNLNLKIEVRKGDCASSMISAHYDTIYPNKLHCITEKSSQADADHIVINCTTNQPRLTNSPVTNTENPKIMVVRNACYDHCTLADIMHKIDGSSVKLDEKNYVILLPNLPYDKNVERSKCDYQQQPDPRASVENPVKKAFVSTSLCTYMKEMLKHAHDDGVLSPDTEVHVEEKDDKLEIVQTKSDRNVPLSNPEISNSKQPVATLNQIESAKNTERTEFPIKNSALNIPKVNVDINTQTDWWSMLLEARRHEDGRYTFHLPPLYVLKQYGFS